MSEAAPLEPELAGHEMPSIDPAEFEGETQVIAVISGAAPMPAFGRLPVNVGGKRCVVKASKPPRVVHDASNLCWTLESRDWCLEVTFSRLDVAPDALDSHDAAVELLDVALEAWNQATGWIKARDMARADRRLAPWPPRLGRVNVQSAAISDGLGRIAFTINPNSLTLLEFSALMPMADMLMTNGPAANPLPDLTDRLQESIDLLNQGFPRESFISALAIFEGTVKSVLSERILRSRGEELTPGARLTRVVRQARLSECLTGLATRSDVGWRSLKDDDPQLLADLLGAYDARNEVMHHGARLDRRGAENGLEIIFAATAWMCGQLGVPPESILPAPNGAVPQFFMWRPGDPPLASSVHGDGHNSGPTEA